MYVPTCTIGKRRVVNKLNKIPYRFMLICYTSVITVQLETSNLYANHTTSSLEYQE